ncbi:MAG: class I SAM-dependent methyltransferase [Lachnospiraceae bacterium]|nr:class I SAM-dependent methyltransferase [Lachnospiraceae bacterium]
MRLSRRLERILALTRGGGTAADIGTDHGYAAIELVRRGICPRVIACDIRQGPLSRAQEHIHAAGLSGQIETRLGDGLERVAPGEAQTLLIAGMGGPLMASILERGTETAQAAEELILSPQSDLGAFRRYLLTHGYRIEAEEALEEDGKYYVILRAAPGWEALWEEEEELVYGRNLLRKGDPLLRRRLEREIVRDRALLVRLAAAGTQRSQERSREIREALTLAERALARMPGEETGETKEERGGEGGTGYGRDRDTACGSAASGAGGHGTGAAGTGLSEAGRAGYRTGSGQWKAAGIT